LNDERAGRRPRGRLIALALFGALALAGMGAAACRDEAPMLQRPAGPVPDSFRVAFTTSRGTIVVEAVRAWAPLGVDRFYALVNEGFFDENRFYRVLPHFIAQFGANGERKRNEHWEKTPLRDDPPREKNLRGTVSFAFLEPNSRTHQLFINLKDNASLDADGFVPIGRVVEGMPVADSLYDDYGDVPKYHMIATLGNKYLARIFPKLDYVKTARLVDAGPVETDPHS
jgi:cyclophilin family peptidyl-prolyl cis-trans isomerase